MTPFKGHRWFAASYDFLTHGAESRVLHDLRPRVAGQATGRVLEVGAGTGANFPYYKDLEHMAATEPDPFMLQRARRRATGLGLHVRLLQCEAEALPFRDASFDTVVATLVFCTVKDTNLALAEVWRVLKPGGLFRFMEHVRAEGVGGYLQDAVTPAWSWFGAGCHLDRRTASTIEGAGFDILELERLRLGPLPLIVGVAGRPGSTRSFDPRYAPGPVL